MNSRTDIYTPEFRHVTTRRIHNKSIEVLVTLSPYDPRDFDSNAGGTGYQEPQF